MKQAPRAWYERLYNDCTLFVKGKDDDILLVQIYVNDIIFSATNESLCEELSNCIKSSEVSMIGELNFFLSLQIKQTKEGLFIKQEKYAKEFLVKSLNCKMPRQLEHQRGLQLNLIKM